MRLESEVLVIANVNLQVSGGRYIRHVRIILHLLRAQLALNVELRTFWRSRLKLGPAGGSRRRFIQTL
jgi:hypothetical protein